VYIRDLSAVPIDIIIVLELMEHAIKQNLMSRFCLNKSFSSNVDPLSKQLGPVVFAVLETAHLYRKILMHAFIDSTISSMKELIKEIRE
jgi:hypothetical protein